MEMMITMKTALCRDDDDDEDAATEPSQPHLRHHPRHWHLHWIAACEELTLTLTYPIVSVVVVVVIKIMIPVSSMKPVVARRDDDYPAGVSGVAGAGT